MSISQENYLKTLYNLQTKNSGPVKTQSLSDSLAVAPGSVTEMLKKLADDGYVSYLPYKGVVLTESGVDLGRKMLRRHRLIELFLCKTLGFSWDEVHEEAENLEHAVSDVLIDRIDTVLGSPKLDPHGDPIPQKDGSIPSQASLAPLNTLKPGNSGEVGRISHDEKSFLKYIDSLSCELGTRITCVLSHAFDGSMDIKINQKTVHISSFTASHIWVVPVQ